VTINVQGNLLTHQCGSRSSTYSISEDGGLRVRVKNPGGVNLDEMTRADRIELARFLRQGADLDA
jgi:hypothetical protein